MINASIFRLPSKPSSESMKMRTTTRANLYRNRLRLQLRLQLHKLKLELLQLIVSIIYQHFMSNANCSRGRFLYNFAHFVLLILILSEDGFDRSRNIRAFIILTCFV